MLPRMSLAAGYPLQFHRFVPLAVGRLTLRDDAASGGEGGEEGATVAVWRERGDESPAPLFASGPPARVHTQALSWGLQPVAALRELRRVVSIGDA